MKRIGILSFVFCTCFALAAWSQAAPEQHKIIIIDVPGAGAVSGLGSQAPGINSEGAIAGFYSDSSNVMHGFLRTPDGKITDVNATGAGDETVPGYMETPGGVMGGQGTYFGAINAAGTIAGFYVDQNNVQHAFLRTPDGKFTTFEAPPEFAGTGEAEGTGAGNINATGWIAGWSVDGNDVTHGLLRAPDGKIITFDVKEAGTGSGQGTFTGLASCINRDGAMTGEYIDGEDVVHGYVRSPDGSIVTFDAPGAGEVTGSFQGTYAWSINDAGETTGEYIDANGVGHGFVRAKNGAITTFDAPLAVQGTVPEGINSEGVIVGNYMDRNGTDHGFLRAPDGNFTYFDVPGAGTGSGQGTIPLTNNSAGVISGVYIDGEGVLHAFLRLP